MKIGRLAKLARVLKNYIDYTGSIADKNERERGRQTRRQGDARKRKKGHSGMRLTEGKERIAEKRGKGRTRVGQWPGYKWGKQFPSWRLDELKAHGGCYSMRDGAREGGWGKKAIGMGILQVDAQTSSGTTKEGWLDKVGSMAGD